MDVYALLGLGVQTSTIKVVDDGGVIVHVRRWLDICWGKFLNILEYAPAGIKPVVSKANHSSAIYTLDGRRLNAKPSKGIYIQNGEKTMIK